MSEKPSPWKASKVKKHLRDDILAGKVPEMMSAREVFVMRQEYKRYAFKNFSTNLRNLRKAIKTGQEKADSDNAALTHDRLIHSVGSETAKGCGYARWEGSDAEWFLKEDVDVRKHKNIAPRDLHKTRPEYQAFPLKVFRDHVHQETHSRLTKAYWMNHQKKWTHNQFYKKTM